MRFLSSRRRHPLAKPLLLVVALFLLGAVYAALAPQSQVAADTGTSQQIKQGRELFAIGCSSCHGLQGQGSSVGPTLQGVGAAAVDFQVGTGRMPLANPSAQAPRKPPEYTPAEVAALAAYVASLGVGPSIPSPDQYSTGGLDQATVARGGELFRTNCSACHNFEGSGGALPKGHYAPSLKGVPPKYLYEAMLTGPQQMPVFSEQVLTPQDKRAIITYLTQLHERPSQGGLAMGGLGPVSEGMWTWFAGIGSLIGFAIWIAAKGAKAK